MSSPNYDFAQIDSILRQVLLAASGERRGRVAELCAESPELEEDLLLRSKVPVHNK